MTPPSRVTQYSPARQDTIFKLGVTALGGAPRSTKSFALGTAQALALDERDTGISTTEDARNCLKLVAVVVRGVVVGGRGAGDEGHSGNDESGKLHFVDLMVLGG